MILAVLSLDPGGGGGGGAVLTAIGVDSGGPSAHGYRSGSRGFQSVLMAIGVDPGRPQYSRL